MAVSSTGKGHPLIQSPIMPEERGSFRSRRSISGFADATALAIVTADASGRVAFWNRAAEAMFGHSWREMIGQPLERIMPARFHSEHAAGLARVAAGGDARLSGKSVEVVALRKDGTEFPIEIAIASWDGATGREFGAQIQDISARRERELGLRHLARHDPLTGLLNRGSFRDVLEEAIRDQCTTTLLALDLDGFKAVNDNFGHAVGDTLLQAIAIRLRAVAEGNGVLGRMGGDEFALLLAPSDDPLAGRTAADRLLWAFAEPFQIAGHTLQIGLSIGIAIAPLHAADTDELLLRADLALLAAKKAGGRRMRSFDNGLRDQLAARRAFKDELRVATEQRQWVLYYQPQVRLADGALVGVEALLRWRHPTRGLILPAAFLPVLETHLVAYEVGNWVIEEACRQLAAWRRAGRVVPRISVNLFAAQFTAGTLERTIAAALIRYGLAPSDLEIEITETIALRPDDQILATLHTLHAAGVNIAFDDFGTGFASLTTLKQVPVSRLKIDRSFVDDVCEAPHSAAIVAAIVSLSERLGLELVAEGIEREAQRAMLMRLGCNIGQGYLLGRPEAGTAALTGMGTREALPD